MVHFDENIFFDHKEMSLVNSLKMLEKTEKLSLAVCGPFEDKNSIMTEIFFVNYHKITSKSPQKLVVINEAHLDGKRF